MNLIKWSPRRELLSLQESMNELFEDSFGRTIRGLEFPVRNFEPLVDIFEDKDNIKLSIELPGMEQEDVKVNVEDNVLSIKGEKRFENEEKKDKYHKIERYYGSFSRSFSLPNSVSQDKIKASFKKGVLELTLPKKESVKPKNIPIQIDVK